MLRFRQGSYVPVYRVWLLVKQFIDQQRLYYPVQLLCQVLYVVPSRYYAWCHRAEITAEPAWETAMVDVFDDHQQRYGTHRLQVELRELGHLRIQIISAHPPFLLFVQVHNAY